MKHHLYYLPISFMLFGIVLFLISPDLKYYNYHIGQTQNSAIQLDNDHIVTFEPEFLQYPGWSDEIDRQEYTISMNHVTESWHGVKTIEIHFPDKKVVSSIKYIYQNKWVPLFKVEW